MSNVLELKSSMDESPQAWQNFFDNCCGDGPTDQWGDVSIEYINSHLSEWRGEYCDQIQPCVAFDSEKSLAWFLLKWG